MLPESTTRVAERREIACVLRDGTSLHTVLLIPEGPGPWPALLTRHPYDVATDETDGRVDVSRFVASGYLVALQDVRGRYRSGGVFDPSTQELDDGADAVAWLAALPECDGRVGMWGASYASETQFSALLGGAPALRSIVPSVTPVASSHDGFRFRGGVPELGSMLGWSHYAIAPAAIARISDDVERDAEQRVWDAADRALTSGTAFAAGSPPADDDADLIMRWMLERLREPADSPAHLAGKIVGRVDEIDIPVFLIGGWYDAFLGSTLEVYRQLRERRAGADAPRLLIGPWSHDNMTGQIAGVDFGAAASTDDLGGHDLTDRHLSWFDATLRENSLPAEAPVRVFLMGADRWVDLEQFPPAGAQQLTLFLTADDGLADEPGSAAIREFTSDPAHPVPTRGGATLLFPPFEPGPVDQTPLDDRADVLSWRSAPLDDDLVVLGAIEAVVRLATTGTDADVVVRLSDEHPDGRALVIADGIQRGSARGLDPVTGLGAVAPLTPGVAEDFVVDLWSTAHVFAAGHRVRVDIASSSSPRWAVGTGSFPVAGGPAEPLATTHTIELGGASRLVLTVPPADFDSVARPNPAHQNHQE